MKVKATKWQKFRRKERAGHCIDFVLNFMLYIAILVASIPIVAVIACLGIGYAIIAGVTAILNAIFYNDPLNHTFNELMDKLFGRFYVIYKK